MGKPKEALTVASLDEAMSTLRKAKAFLQAQEPAEVPQAKPEVFHFLKRKPKSEPVVQSSESKAHHEMKALLKALPKAKQKDFTKAWKTLQKASKWPTGTMPKPKYFELQMQAYASVA